MKDIERIDKAIKKEREALDLLDNKIVSLLLKRSIIVKKIAKLKISKDMQIRDIQREEEIKKRLQKLSKHEKDYAYLVSIYEGIISASIKIQEEEK